jgi:hypothetical protein
MALKKFPAFTTLWSSYPHDSEAPPGSQHAMPCDEKDKSGFYFYENQCAIRMSHCLIKAGISLSNYTDPKCKHGYARGAESLATWIWRNFGKPLQVDCSNAAQKNTFLTNQYWSKNGIIFFKDFYGTNNTGDHIDLLYHVNTQILTATGNYTNDGRVKQIWFWEVN